MSVHLQKQAKVRERIASIEASLRKAREYLESGQHAEWRGFRPLFACKRDGDREAPPHRDWVKNVFIPRHERALRKAERALDRLADHAGADRWRRRSRA